MRFIFDYQFTYEFQKSINNTLNCFIFFLDNLDEFDDELPAPVRNIADDGGGVMALDGETVLQTVNPGGLPGSEFAYTTPCLVKGIFLFIMFLLDVQLNFFIKKSLWILY